MFEFTKYSLHYNNGISLQQITSYQKLVLWLIYMVSLQQKCTPNAVATLSSLEEEDVLVLVNLVNVNNSSYDEDGIF